MKNNKLFRLINRWYWILLYKITGTAEYSWRGRYCKYCGCDLEPIEPGICMDCYYGGYDA